MTAAAAAPPPPPAASPPQLTESQLTSAFHSFLKGALSQAHAERLLTDEMLASAEGDLMVEGPALCLFFAALRASTHPPSLLLPPTTTTSGSQPPLLLNLQTCPPAFHPLFRLWSSTVPPIRALPPNYQHDLCRLLCDLDPLSSPVRESLPRLAGELRAVAIEISQRRTFQERYGGDLQAVLDRAGSGRQRATWEAPPEYEPAPREKALPPVPPQSQTTPPPRSARLSVPPSPLRPSSPSSPNTYRAPSPLRAQFPPSPLTPTLSTPHTPDPVLALIRETLYAALADVLSLTPALHALLHSDPAQAYFASVSLAILQVCLSQISQDGEVRGVLGRAIREEEVNLEYRPFMAQLVRIALRAQLMSEEDDARAVRYLAKDRPLPVPRLDRLRRQLLEGAGAGLEDDPGSPGHGRASTPSGTVTALANRINVVALTWVRLPAFRDRQGEVFEVLRGAGR
ncbi:hypothetical protein CALVIDRAFT_480212 [Calocera viscosa TUFC12733]|uniref:Uncharacterized protein n=1 Tax=Calocera viscosa (strain TUFC12733) TaxID=1330018 RepID=A0A167N6Y6_CALVF|nr:hypothetical protein CALVIDRAFT_480212 [Calocera viscosa TUFC12733]